MGKASCNDGTVLGICKSYKRRRKKLLYKTDIRESDNASAIRVYASDAEKSNIEAGAADIDAIFGIYRSITVYIRQRTYGIR